MKYPPISLRLLAALTALVSAASFSPAATYLWNADPPAANNWNVNANWLPNTGSPGAGDTAIFGDIGLSPDAVTVNNVVSVNTTVSALTFTNTTTVTTGPWHVTEIPAGVTLTLTNLTVGLGASTPGTGLKTLAAVTGGGTLLGYGTLTAGNSATSGANPGTALDLSGLTSFVWSNSAATVSIGIANRSAVDLKLAASSNSVTAGTINFNTTSTGNAAAGTVTLGAGTNTLNAGTISAALQRNSCTIQFPAVSGPEAGLRIRGSSGADDSRANLTLANRNSGGSGGTSTGQLLLEGHPVNLKLATLNLGLGGGTPTGLNTGTGVISFDNGIIDVTTINMAQTAHTLSAANATMNVGANATLVVGSGGLSLANLLAGSSAANGTLNINGGSVVCSNSITKANTNASGVATITVNGGSLAMMSGGIGSTTVPIDALNLTDARLTLAADSGGTNVVVATLSTASSTNNQISISRLPLLTSYPTQIPLISYASLNNFDFQLGSLPAASPAYTGYLSNNTANGTIDLVITGGPAVIRTLTWNGNVNGNWDTTTANWLFAATPVAYSQGDFVAFDDKASGVTTVNLATGLSPNLLTISNNNKSYTFTGSGSMGGTVTLTKAGSGLFTLANSGVNNFAGGVNILEGTLQLGGNADRLPTNTTVTLADVAGAKLDLNNFSQTLQSLNGGGYNGGNLALGSGNLTAWGGGVFGGVISGTGQLIKTNFVTGGTLTLTNAHTYSGGTIIGGFTNNTTLAVGNTTGSGTGSGYVRVLTNGTFALGNGGPGGSVAVGVIANDGTVSLNRSEDFTLSQIIVGAGGLSKANTNTASIAGTNGYAGLTAIGNGSLRISNPGALGSGTAYVQNGTATLQLVGGITFTNTLRVASKPSGTGIWPCVENLSGSNTLSGPLELNQNGSIGWQFYATAGRLRISGAMTPMNSTTTSQNTTRNLVLTGDAVGEWSGNIIDPVGGTTNLTLRKDGLGTWVLSGSNTYSGATTLNAGTLLVNGSLGTNAVTVNGGVLGGLGLINGSVKLFPLPGTPAALSPGESIGTLTVKGDLTLIGGDVTTILEVSHAANDQVTGINTLGMDGTLRVIVNGPLKGGEVFKLFAAAAYAGDFSVYDLPTLPGTLGWDYSAVPVDGTLKVTGTGPPIPPVIGSFTPASGSVGTGVVITGSFFTGATSVKFNGTSAPDYTVNSDTQITVKVPAGATTGTISVTTPDGTTTSASSFTVVSIPPPTIPPVTVSGNNLVVAVPTVVGGQYVLQSATNLTPAIYWRNETTNAGTGANVIFNVPIEAGTPQKFVRIWVY